MSERTFVYRAYGADGRLLYVGVTDDVERRILQHSGTAAIWIPLLESLTLEYFSDRDEALRAEADAILTEWPLWNMMGSIDPHTPTLIKRRTLQEGCALNWSKPPRTREQVKADWEDRVASMRAKLATLLPQDIGTASTKAVSS